MSNIDMYKCTDVIDNMKESLIKDGLIGVYGTRVSTRSKLSKVVDQLNDEGSENDYIYLAYNHPDTELGYAFNHTKYSLEEAKSIVLILYDKNFTTKW